MARMDIDYEDDGFDGSKKPRVIVKKKGGLLGKIVALLLGIVIGIVGGIGGLVGAGYYAVTKVTIKDAANTVTNLSGFQIPLSDYLSDEYANKTVVGLIESISDTATKISDGTGTLNDLNKISPFISTFLTKEGGLIDLLADYGIETTADELMGKFLVKTAETEGYDDEYLTDFLLLKIDEIPFAKLLQTVGIVGSDMITILCYGEEGVDYVLEDGEYVMLGDSKPLTISGFLGSELDNRIEQLPLDAVMGTPQDEIMSTLFYGATHRYTRTENGVVMNQVFYTYDGEYFYDDNGDKLDLTGKTAVSGQEDTYLLTFKDGTKQIVKLGTENKYYAFTVEETPQIIRFKKTTIWDLKGDEAENLINSITLESALKLNDKSHAILKSIAYGENGEKHTIKDLRERGNDLIDGITLEAALNLNDESHAVLRAIAYGENDEKRTIQDLREQGGNLINDIQLSEIISADDPKDAVIMYLLYGKEDVHYYIPDGSNEPKPMQKRVALYGENVYNEYGELIKDAKANGTTSYKLGETTYTLTKAEGLEPIEVEVTTGSTTTPKNATLYYVSLNGEAVNYEFTTIGDMQNGEILSKLTGRLQLKDVMDVGDNKILKHLEEETIDDLPTAINTLTIDDVFGDQFTYRTRKGDDEYKSYRKNGNHQPIDKDEKVVTGAYLIDINNENVDSNNDGVVTREEADKALTGTWKYLLMNPDTGEIEHDHTIIEMEEMIDYMSKNIHAATVRALQRDGIVENLSDETLEKPIVDKISTTTIKISQKAENVPEDVPEEDREYDASGYIKYPVTYLGDKIGDLTIEQLMLYMDALLEITSTLA